MKGMLTGSLGLSIFFKAPLNALLKAIKQMQLIVFTPNFPISMPGNVLIVYNVLIEILTFKLFSEEKTYFIDKFFETIG
jgi:hypothetical protein